MKKRKKLPSPSWTTTVSPGEYDYLDQFARMVRLANKNKEIYTPMDVGKVWGLVLAHKEANERIEALTKGLNDIHILAHCLAKAGPLNTPDLATAWVRFMEISAKASNAAYQSK